VEWHNRPGQTAPVVIQQQHRVDEGVRQARLMAHGVGVADVEPLVDQRGRQVPAAGAMPFCVDHRVGRFAPGICRADPLEGTRFDRVECKDAERCNAILAEVLVLVIAPDQNEIRVERVQCRAHGAEPIDRTTAMRGRGLTGLVPGPFALHLWRPTGGSLAAGGNRGLFNTRSKMPAIRSSVPTNSGECVTPSPRISAICLPPLAARPPDGVRRRSTECVRRSLVA
jgi:hypothetical protein